MNQIFIGNLLYLKNTFIVKFLCFSKQLKGEQNSTFLQLNLIKCLVLSQRMVMSHDQRN